MLELLQSVASDEELSFSESGELKFSFMFGAKNMLAKKELIVRLNEVLEDKDDTIKLRSVVEGLERKL